MGAQTNKYLNFCRVILRGNDADEPFPTGDKSQMLVGDRVFF